jgi:hypothetical protein
MSLLWRAPQEGDWVNTTRPIKTTIADYVLRSDTGIRRGTRGVVTRTFG